MNYRQYLYSDNWKKLKKQVYERAVRNARVGGLPFGICEKCGYVPYKPGVLQVHHKTYDRVFHEQLEDLILLCPNCHRAEHELLKERENNVSGGLGNGS